ncbi:hypothetical protein FF2_035884 [Malus domestica]
MFSAMAFPPDTSKTIKLERYNSYLRRVNSTKLLNASSKLLFCCTRTTPTSPPPHRTRRTDSTHTGG